MDRSAAPPPIRLTTLALLALLLSGCGGDTAPNAGEDPSAAAVAAPAGEPEGVADLRRVTAGYTDIEAARSAGYSEQITSCWYHREQGGQGYHFGRTELIDGTVTALEPELVMYEPRPDGSMEFIGIEYIVPYAAWNQPAPPQLFGQSFMQNDQLELHVMHVWVGKENPSGLFASWNPDVSCEHAEESEDRA